MQKKKSKKADEKQNSATTMTSVNGKWRVFPVKLKLQGNCLNKDIKSENFKKDLMNLIETFHQINMNFDHSVSNNNSFRSHLNAKSFNMFLTLQKMCKAQ